MIAIVIGQMVLMPIIGVVSAVVMDTYFLDVYDGMQFFLECRYCPYLLKRCMFSLWFSEKSRDPGFILPCHDNCVPYSDCKQRQVMVELSGIDTKEAIAQAIA